MPTIDSKHLIDEIIANNGVYMDDPQIVKIVAYTNAWGKTSYGLIYEGMRNDNYSETEYVRNPHTIWEFKSGN